jgi:hypothetical protein
MGRRSSDWAREQIADPAARGLRKFRIAQQADDSSFGHELHQQSQPFAAEERTKKAHPSDVAARTIEAGDEAGKNWVAAETEYDRNCRGRGLSGGNRSAAAGGRDHRHLAADEIGCKHRQSIAAPSRPPITARPSGAVSIAP